MHERSLINLKCLWPPAAGSQQKQAKLSKPSPWYLGQADPYILEMLDAQVRQTKPNRADPGGEYVKASCASLLKLVSELVNLFLGIGRRAHMKTNFSSVTPTKVWQSAKKKIVQI